ncbi:hypothetical protein [Streptomyces sp. NPDC001843]|uniref:hypothetical protein n=1 Tax=Streptomyces sp. NPDC001843 TaxID=3364617 RepID=UPI003685202C
MPDEVRDAVLDDVALSFQNALDADELSKIRIYLSTVQGLDTYEIAEKLGISQTSASKYARQGKEAYERRQQEKRESESTGDRQLGEDPLRPEQREPVG